MGELVSRNISHFAKRLNLYLCRFAGLDQVAFT